MAQSQSGDEPGSGGTVRALAEHDQAAQEGQKGNSGWTLPLKTSPKLAKPSFVQVVTMGPLPPGPLTVQPPPKLATARDWNKSNTRMHKESGHALFQPTSGGEHPQGDLSHNPSLESKSHKHVTHVSSPYKSHNPR